LTHFVEDISYSATVLETKCLQMLVISENIRKSTQR